MRPCRRHQPGDDRGYSVPGIPATCIQSTCALGVETFVATVRHCTQDAPTVDITSVTRPFASKSRCGRKR